MTDMKAARVSAQIAFLLAALPTTALAQSTIRVDVTPGHAINAFDPDSALGSSIDVLSRTDINRVYTPRDSSPGAAVYVHAPESLDHRVAGQGRPARRLSQRVLARRLTVSRTKILSRRTIASLHLLAPSFATRSLMPEVKIL